MANRYLRATGNWNGAVWADTSSGAAGSAATPTASDSVYIQANFTVTLTADAECERIYHTNGRLNLSGYTLTAGVLGGGNGFVSSGDNARTIDLGGGKLVANDFLSLFDTNLSLLVANSVVELNVGGEWQGGFDTLSKTFNDVIINIGVGSGSSGYLNITGSPTFRSLTIQSKNSAAHTVNFDNNAFLNVNKFIAIGYSSSNKLTLVGNSDGVAGTSINLSPGGSSYGQFVHANGVKGNTYSGVPKYLGNNSTQTTGITTMGWLLQDPPKISTLVDPLTTAPGSNPNWTVTGTVTQVTTGHGGGGYKLASGATMTTTDTYDLVDIPYVVETTDSGYGLNYSPDIENNLSEWGPPLQYRFNKITESGGNRSADGSSDGVSWTNFSSDPGPEAALVRSTRLKFSNTGSSDLYVYSINPSMSTGVSKTQDGSARISKIVTSSRQSQSRISKLFSVTSNSISRVGKLFWTDQVSISRLQNISASAQESLARIRATFTYSRGSYNILPSGSSDLENTYTSTEVSNVGAEDSIYTSQAGSGYVLHQYKKYHNLDTATITIKWIGKTTVPPTEETVSLQIYNYDSNSWVTLDSNSTSSAGVNFQLLGVPAGDTSNYYDPDGFISVRIYQ